MKWLKRDFLLMGPRSNPRVPGTPAQMVRGNWMARAGLSGIFTCLWRALCLQGARKDTGSRAEKGSKLRLMMRAALGRGTRVERAEPFPLPPPEGKSGGMGRLPVASTDKPRDDMDEWIGYSACDAAIEHGFRPSRTTARPLHIW